MITKFHIYESSNKIPKNIVISAGNWFESQFPKEDYYDWEYNNLFYGTIEYLFYYEEFVDEWVIDEMYDYLEEEGIDWEFGYGIHSTAPDDQVKKQTMLSFKLKEEQIYKYADMYNEMKKFNL